MSSENTPQWAIEHARTLHEEEAPERWQHVRATIAKARAFAPAVPGDEDLLVTAAALHDAGFASVARDTGFSTLDSALHVRRIGGHDRLVDLIAHQFVGTVEAELRDLGGHYAAFGPDEEGPVRDALWTACMTTGTNGHDVTVRERCDGWRTRYPFAWLQEYLDRCQSELEAAEQRTLDRLR